MDTELDRSGYPPHPTTLSRVKCKISSLESGHRTRISVNVPRSNRLFPDPSLPQTRESSPRGKLRDKSTSRNLCLGVDAAEGAMLVVARS